MAELVVMQFLLFDVSATLVFLFGYSMAVTLQRRRALLVLAEPAAPSRQPARPAREPGQPKSGEACEDCSTPHEPRRDWPRLSYPR
jgi:hypothetical protein